MSEKEHDRKCWNCEFDDFCSWTAAGEEDAKLPGGSSGRGCERAVKVRVGK